MFGKESKSNTAHRHVPLPPVILDETINHSDVPRTPDHIMRLPTTDSVLEGSQMSAAASITHEQASFRDEYDMDTSDFDVTRPDRELLQENHETSLQDETVVDLPEDAPIIYEMVEGGSVRGGQKLVSSDGYAYVKKRTLVFQAIVRLLPSTQVQTFVTDFEAGIWQGLRSVFNDPDIRGCAFHFGQALWRKAQECGLQTAYSTRDAVYRLMRKVFALPLLPAGDIPAAFRKIEEKMDANDERMVSFLQYVSSTWIQNEMWPVASWSVFGHSIRTNNDVEGWHARLNRRAKKGNLPFYLLVELLYKEAQEIPIMCKLVKERKLCRYQRKATTLTQGRLMKLWAEYSANELTTSSLLKACGRLYGPV
ncbi:uncharacterized protein LOC128215495 [Mya arenaria]|uniref:uncharacterized protein LOC128215495 n=1 Tax=Mya arenaria TaxID=6604 RepID=UPI0022E80B8E|nr:uncharacterized protein LOC128215495 [Mya arenaria]